jgi:multidrug resistance efflux pump
MIIFLTLLYVGVLAILVKLKVIQWTLFWKLSPLLWMLFLFLVLFLPMQWGAPSGEVRVFNYVVEIVPNVSGEVIEVPAEGMGSVKKGDVLFQIDPSPFEAEVDRLEAALQEAKQTAKTLPVELDAAKAAVAEAESALVEAKQRAKQLDQELIAAKAGVESSEAQLLLAETRYRRQKSLLEKNAASKDDVDAAERNLAAAQATADQATALLASAKLVVDSQVDGVNTGVIQAERSLDAARAAESKAQLALESQVNGVNTTVAQIEAQLRAARLDLQWSTVRAPSDGTVTNVSLQPGQRVANLPLRSWMAFLDTSRNRIGFFLPQYAMRHIQPGMPAELTLKLHPGKTFQATVSAVAPVNASGQVQPSGQLPTLLPPSADEQRLLCILEIDDERIDRRTLPGGAVGTATVYTEKARVTHIIRRIMIRMEAWKHYVIP